MKYQLADLHNGPFGEVFETMAEAEKALAEVIEEGDALNALHTPEGHEAPRAEDFFLIVEAGA